MGGELAFVGCLVVVGLFLRGLSEVRDGAEPGGLLALAGLLLMMALVGRKV